MTEKQKELVNFIKSYYEENNMPPKIKDMAEEFGVVVSTIHERLDRLEDKGFIKRNKHKHRSIKLLKDKESLYKEKASVDHLIRDFEDKFMTVDPTEKEEEMFDWVQDTLKEIVN